MSRLKFLFALVCFCVMSTTAWAAKPEGLLAEWNFDEGKGEVARDSSGNGRDAMVSGASWIKQGDGFALSLDGVDDYVEFARGPALGLTGPVTVEAWVKPMRKAERLTVLLGQDLHSYLLTYANADHCYWYIGSGANGIAAQVKLYEWSHIAATFDGKRATLYVNGRPAAGRESRFKSYPQRDRFGMGTKGRPDLPHFKGLLNNVRVYNRALSEDEVVAHVLAEGAVYGLAVKRQGRVASEEATLFFKDHPGTVAVTETQDRILFANQRIGLEFGRSKQGFELTRFYDIVNDREFLSKGDLIGFRNLFEVVMTLDPKYVGRDDRGKEKGSLTGIMQEMAGDAFSIGSQAGKLVSWRREGTDSESRLHLEWKEIDVKENKGVLDVEVIVTLRAGDPLSYWRINVHNRGARYGIERVRFPILSLAPIGKAQDNVFLHPSGRGNLVVNPFSQPTGFGRHYDTRGADYTCYFNMQFQALYNSKNGQGVFLGTRDPTPNLINIQIVNTPAELSWRPGHFPPNIAFAQEAPGGTEEDFKVPYDCVAGPFQGDWFDACHIYRKWALKQSWCSKGPLSKRADMPKWYKESPFIFYTTFNDSAAGTHSMDENLRIGADHFREWLKWAGMKLPANFYAWEQPVHGLSVRDLPFHIARSQLMYPSGPSSGRRTGMTGHNYYDGNYPGIQAMRDFSAECGRLRKEGGMVCPYIALELCNQGPSENAPYAAEAKPHAIRDLYGCIRTWGGDRTWQMCSWPSWWRKRLTETCVLMLERENVGGFYLDVMRGSCLPCYWTAHGHTAAGGSSMTTGRHELVKIIQEAVRAKDPEAIITGENPSENMIDVTDGFLTNTLDADTAPIFAAVYQDYALRYGLEISGSPKNFFIQSASLFVEGMQIGRIRLRPRPGSLSFQKPEHKEMIDFLGRVLGYYRQETAKKFLVYGQLMRPLEFGEPASMPMLSYKGGKFPALMSGVFRSEDGELGIFVVNVSSDQQKFETDIDLARYGMTKDAVVDLDSITSDSTSKNVLNKAKGKVTLKGALPGHGITMFRLRPAVERR